MIEQNYGDISPKEFALDVIDRLNERYDLRLDDIILNHALTTAQKKTLLTTQLLEVIWADLDAHNVGAGIEYEPTEHDDQLLTALAATNVELEPNITLTEHNANIIRGYQGDDVYNYLFTLTKRFENMAAAKTPGQLAIEIVSGSLVSIGVAMTVGTIKALRAGSALLAAVKTGVTSIGMKTAIGVVIFVLVALLLFLLLENPKKILGLIINDSDEDFVVTNWRKGVDGGKGGDLYLEHGYMESFPEDHETGDLDSPLVQIRKRFYFGPDDPDNTVCAGIYFGDRNIGFRGVEGIMVFSSKTTNTSVAHMFAVPYTKDNGTNMRLLTSKPDPNSLPALFREMYNARKVRVDTTTGGYRLTATVNHARGGVVGLIGYIQKV